MADQFQIPQRNPPAPQFQPPTDLVNAYINRPTPAETATQGLGNAMNSFTQYKQYQYNKYLEEQKLKAGAFEAGGPYLMNMLYGTGQPTASTTAQGQVAGTAMPSQAPSAPTPMPQGTAGVSPTPQGIGQPQQASQPLMHPTSGLPQTIHDIPGPLTPQANAGIGGQNAQDQYLAGLGLRPDQAGQLGMMGTFGNKALLGLKTVGDLALQPGQQALQQQAIQKGGFEASQQPIQAETNRQHLINEQQQIPNWIAGKSAEEQNKYQTPEMKVQAATMKLQELYDAYQKVSPSAKGAIVGTVTGTAGSVAGGVAPDLVTYNKLRDDAITMMAIAKNPENPRPSAEDKAAIAKDFPSAADDPRVALNMFNAAANDLTKQHNLLTQGAQAAASAYGGSIKPGKTPALNMGQAKIPTISNDAAFKALPSGAQFKDPSGQIHRKK
jgi:hypothetical protein